MNKEYAVVRELHSGLQIQKTFDTFEEADAYLNEKWKRRNTSGTYIIKKETK